MPTVTHRTYRNKKEKKELGYKKSKEWSEFYGSRAWDKLRNWYINLHPLCENCMTFGFTTPAEHVHHITPFRTGTTKEDKWDLFLDPTNLMALCSDCHHKIHNKINETGIITRYVRPSKLDTI